MIQWLTDTLIATTLLMAAVLALRTPVTRLFGPRVAYALWLLPAARLFMPPLVRTIELAAPAGDSSVGPFPAAAAAPIPADAGPDWTVALLTLWIAGALLVFLARSASYVELRGDILSEARPVARYGRVRLVESIATEGPVAFGMLRPYIAVPPSFFSGYGERERELALAHELSHHRSGDLAVNFAAFLLLCLHWFNPVAWAAWRAFRFDQEAACDARVLAAAAEEDRPVYGRAVAKAATGRPLVFASSLNPRNSLKKRLKTMALKEKTSARRALGLAAIGAATALALPLTATVSYAVAYVQPEPVALAEPPAPAEPIAPRDAAFDEPAPVAAPDPAAFAAEHAARAGHPDEVDWDAVRESIPTREEIAAMIPDIDIREDCGGDTRVAQEVGRRPDGGEIIRIRLCGEEIAREARAEALQGLREARDELAAEPDMPGDIRSQVLAELDRQIARMSAEAR